MGYKDLHIKPFDKGTIAKLEIFEDYAQAWIPTFVMQSASEIHIFDFFSGPGYDSKMVPGSPIRLLKKINEHLGNILNRGTKIVLHLNEFEPNKKKQAKFEMLKENCCHFIQEQPKFKYFLKVHYYNESAEQLFFNLLPLIEEYPSLVYLDQNGVKFVSEEYINKFESLNTTDFLYFVSSSFFKRFGTTDEFKRVLDFDLENFEKAEYRNIHRLVIEKIKSKLSQNTKLKLFPFSIKKGANIYGIIFGAKHFRAVDKFLDIAWKRNKLNGEADFDIDEDLGKGQLYLFGSKKMTKIEKFQNDLEKKILKGELVTNQDVLIYTYESGHSPQHSTELVKRLKGAQLHYEGRTPGINYDNVFKKKNIVNYTLKKN